MSKIKSAAGSILIVLFLLGGGFAGGYFCYEYLHSDKAEIVESDDEDITLPFEEEKRTVTIEEVKTVIKEIAEFSTYEGDYTVHKAVDEARYILEAKVPGTKNTIDITCKGIVKVGYNLDQVIIKVDNGSKKIYISLPEPKINDNYVIWDSVECKEKNTILNPINFKQYQKLISELEELGKTDAEKQGIYKKAEINMKKLLDKTLLQFDGYEIVYMEKDNAK